MMRGARCGPRDGQILDMVPAVEMRWDAWVALHPDTKVIAINSVLNRNYQEYPYGDYESLTNAETLFPQGELDGRRPPKSACWGSPLLMAAVWRFPSTHSTRKGTGQWCTPGPRAGISSCSGTVTPRRR